MRRVCEKYAQSHEKHARRPCATFASERLAGKKLQNDSETIFEGFNGSHWILRDSGAVPKDVKQFQKELQNMVRERATTGYENWTSTLSPRIPLTSHPLR